MRTYGDISENDRQLVSELMQLEKWFNDHSDSIPQLSSSKGLVSMAHDYYCIFMEEEGERLIAKAVTITPDYFHGPIYDHMDKDVDFTQLIAQLGETPAIDLMLSLGFRG